MCAHTEARVLGRRLNGHQGVRPTRLIGLAATVVQCCGCGLIYANPRPVPDTLAQHYDRPPEDYWQPSYFDDAAGYFDEAIARFRHLWDGAGTPRALDVGAGLGKAMASLTRHGFDTFGFEPSAAFRDRALASGVSADRLQLAAIETAQYADGAFDLVTFGAVLEHLSDPAAALEKALGWTAPRGLIHAEVPSARWLMARLLDRVYRLQGLDYVTRLSPMHAPFHLYEFTLEAFERHGSRVGYSVADHHFHVCDTFLPPPLRGVAAKVMGATDTGMQLEVWLRR